MPSRPDVAIHAGHPASSVVVHVPHSATRIPADARVGIDLHDDPLQREAVRSADMGTDALASSAVYALTPTPWRVVNQVSRLVVDPERFVAGDDTERWGRGAVATVTTDGSPLRTDDERERAALLERYYAPYSATVASVVRRALDDVGRCTIIDLHGYPKDPWPVEPDQHARRPPICLGTDPFHTPEELVVLAERAFEGIGLATQRNTPYSGTYVPEPFTHADSRVWSLMIEVRKDVHLRDGLRTIDPRGAGLVVKALRSIVANAEVLSMVPDYRRTVLKFAADTLHDGHVLSACAPWSQRRPDDHELADALRTQLQTEGVSAIDVDASAVDEDGTSWSEPSQLLLGSDRADACRRGRAAGQWAVFEIAEGRLRIVACATEDVIHDAPMSAVREGHRWLVQEAV